MFRFILKSISTLLIVGVMVYFYSKEIEPHLLKVTKHELIAPLSQARNKEVRVVQFTDTHVGEFFNLKDMQKVVDKINKLKPDIVVFTGDLVDHWGKYEEEEELQVLLNSIKASFGKFAVFGNHDYGSSGYKIYEDFMEGAGFKVLVNERIPIILKEGRQINIVGIDDALLGKPNIEKVVKQLNPKDYNILLLHEPDLVDVVPKGYIDLQLSGHSHGGQVEIPKLVDKFLPKYGVKYSEGMYRINERTQLYVNRGIGSTKLPFRLGNIPEISLFKIK